MRAAGRSAIAPQITQADLHDGCREQMRGALQMQSSAEHAASTNQSGTLRSLDTLILPAELQSALQTIRAFEKARALALSNRPLP